MTKKSEYQKYISLCTEQELLDPFESNQRESSDVLNDVEKANAIVDAIGEEFLVMQAKGLNVLQLLDNEDENVRYWTATNMMQKSVNTDAAKRTLADIASRSIFPWRKTTSRAKKASLVLKYYSSTNS